MITLASDFGTPYPAAMKGVLCQRTTARLVDIAHDFPRQDVRAAAFWLREVLPYFPPATHLVVIDPGVGTDRHALVIRAGEHVLVGPDNGVLCPVARRLAGDGALETHVIDETRLESVAPTGQVSGANARAISGPDGDAGPASNTFHGRDVFAPAAAGVHETDRDALADLEWLSPLEDCVELELPKAVLEDERARGEVLVVDGFGNVITNVPGRFLAGRDQLVVADHRIPVGETFAAVEPGERLATVGSHGYVELDVNRGRGDVAFGLEAGDRVVLEERETAREV
ncbi:SAM hydrolase/SAM-dependent halogenase family protein [Natronorubrum sulfidifaciens]|uniref:NAD operon protein n=1 Tax=Natronorubrum sulfidifaciens JCM 14089 TaxID=1230460 RepID=L9W7R6_9EURY|nr:SAM-dependent chlorinase/fluorinase [Natronorubrum sulfidifaciens]ELY44378.1 NAD operon protein [Natronorubrum sulfidifaciens JCM 14089]